MNSAATHPDAADPRLRGRTYRLPFQLVWRTALELLHGLRRWRVLEADPRRGVIRAEARSAVWKFVDDVELQLSLDDLGFTRVDMRSRSRTGRFDMGVNVRRVVRTLAALDRRLQRETGQG